VVRACEDRTLHDRAHASAFQPLPVRGNADDSFEKMLDSVRKTKQPQADRPGGGEGKNDGGERRQFCGHGESSWGVRSCICYLTRSNAHRTQRLLRHHGKAEGDVHRRLWACVWWLASHDKKGKMRSRTRFKRGGHGQGYKQDETLGLALPWAHVLRVAMSSPKTEPPSFSTVVPGWIMSKGKI
jgi:hypothetical protein